MNEDGFDDVWPGTLLTGKWMAKDQAEEEEEEAKFNKFRPNF